MYAPGEDVARLTYFGLHALQHRGQESAGIAVGDGDTVTVTKNLGLVSRVFKESDLDSLTGDVAIGHTRYSTTGSSTSWENAQPHLSAIGHQVIALAHNGNLVNTVELRDALKGQGIRFRSTTDSEVMPRSSATSRRSTSSHPRGHPRDDEAHPRRLRGRAHHRGRASTRSATRTACARSSSASSTTAAGSSRARRARSTSSAPTFVRDVAPGEMIKISAERRRGRAGRARREALAVHVRVRLLRAPRLRDVRLLALRGAPAAWAPRSRDRGAGRGRHGHGRAGLGRPGGGRLRAARAASRSARGSRRTATSAARSSRRARRSASRASGSSSTRSSTRSRASGSSSSTTRSCAATPRKKLVALLREAGAAEVHMRITSPPVKWPCFYGIDTDTQEQLIAVASSRSRRSASTSAPTRSRTCRSTDMVAVDRRARRRRSASPASTASTRSRSPTSVKRGKLALETVE